MEKLRVRSLLKIAFEMCLKRIIPPNNTEKDHEANQSETMRKGSKKEDRRQASEKPYAMFIQN
jgi:hypothetical protein